MTNLQLYLVIGIPSLIALLGMLTNAALYINLSSTLNARMTSLEARMLNLENTFTARFDLLMGRLIELEKEIHRGH